MEEPHILFPMAQPIPPSLPQSFVPGGNSSLGVALHTDDCHVLFSLISKSAYHEIPHAHQVRKEPEQQRIAT